MAPPALRSKFTAIYEQLFQGLNPEEISSTSNPSQFWSDLFSLDVDGPYLADSLARISNEACLGPLKAMLHTLFTSALTFFRESEGVVKANSLDTLVILVHALLQRNFAGWEVMEVLAGDVGASDIVFSELVIIIDATLADTRVPVPIRHRTLQLGLVFMCGIAQLSPGAYFLRRNLFPTLASMIVSPQTQIFAFEAVLFLSILANYHLSDAGNLNPYLRQIIECTDETLMRKICWVASFACQATTKSYQKITDDTPPTLTSSLFKVFTPESSVPHELFKSQPIEASIILYPVFQFTKLNPTFVAAFLTPKSESSPPLPHVILTLSSYILTHASSTASPRALAYAQLTLTLFASFIENEEIMNVLCECQNQAIWTCHQRLPALPTLPTDSPPLCTLLDCTVLFVRHNLHKKLAVTSYITCMETLQRIFWSLHYQKTSLMYHWSELWRALFLLLEFTSTKLDAPGTLPRLDALIKSILEVLELAITLDFLPAPSATHELVYELIHSCEILSKQHDLLLTLQSATGTPTSINTLASPSPSLQTLQVIISHYLALSPASPSASQMLKLIAREVDKEGAVFGRRDVAVLEKGRPGKTADGMVDGGFGRWVCADGMALMPIS